MRGFYKPPKFRKGVKVKTPTGQEGHIVQISYEGGVNWYMVKDKYYAETELTKV